MFNPTCLVTGKKDNLTMHAHRNINGDMVGWVFVHESVDVGGLDIDWKLRGTMPQPSKDESVNKGQ